MRKIILVRQPLKTKLLYILLWCVFVLSTLDGASRDIAIYHSVMITKIISFVCITSAFALIAWRHTRYEFDDLGVKVENSIFGRRYSTRIYLFQKVSRVTRYPSGEIQLLDEDKNVSITLSPRELSITTVELSNLIFPHLPGDCQVREGRTNRWQWLARIVTALVLAALLLDWGTDAFVFRSLLPIIFQSEPANTFVAPDGAVWYMDVPAFGTKDRLNRLSADGKEYWTGLDFLQDQNGHDRYVFAIAENSQHQPVIVMDEAMATWDGSAWQQTSIPLYANFVFWSGDLIDGNRNIWDRTDDGLFKINLDTGEGTTILLPQAEIDAGSSIQDMGIRDGKVYCLLEDDRDQVKMLVLDHGNWQELFHFDKGAEMGLFLFSIDADQTIWLAAEHSAQVGKVLAGHQNVQWMNIQPSTDSIDKFTIDSYQRLWLVSTDEVRVYALAGNEFQLLRMYNPGNANIGEVRYDKVQIAAGKIWYLEKEIKVLDTDQKNLPLPGLDLIHFLFDREH